MSLLKRRWLEMALFCGKISLEQVINLAHAGVYSGELRFYYPSGTPGSDGYYHPDLNEAKIAEFIRRNSGYKTTLLDVLDKDTRALLAK